MPAHPTVYAVVVTYNRRQLLVECLQSLAAQTHPLAGVLVVDNASTDGTLEHLLASGVTGRLAVDYLRLARNGGGAEGFHYGVRHARDVEADWIWLMDDDCEAPPECLAELVAHPRARDPQTVLLAPLLAEPGGALDAGHRGWMRRRWFLSPLVGLSAEHFDRTEVAIEMCSLVGPLVRTEVARAIAPPPREFFIWWDDLDWTFRLGTRGRLWLVPGSRIVHKDPRPASDLSWRARWREFQRPEGFARAWKEMYGLRNLIHWGRRQGYITVGRAASYWAVAAGRALAFEPPRLRTVQLLALYARWGWQGTFLNVSPAHWSRLSEHPDPAGFIRRHALRYDNDTDGSPRRLLAYEN